jgi:FtsZ-interacting cell division protein ZipA
MPELRWTLLILGVVFIAALAWWELRRPRQSVHGSQDRLAPTLDPSDEPAHPPHVHREPTLTLPEIRPREQPQEIPVVEVADDSLIGLRVDGERPEQAPAALEQAAVPILPEPPEDDDRTAQLSVETPEVPPLPAAPIVDWPPEDVRRILAVRLVSGPERFPGRGLRQALAAEGFLFGRFSIFHKPGADARAVVSAASLSKPGIFTPESMDSQRFAGLNLFAILPGPLPPAEAFEELLATARSLNDRLQGGLQDEVGKPLTPARIASLREGLATPGAPAPEAQPSTPPQEGAESPP